MSEVCPGCNVPTSVIHGADPSSPFCPRCDGTVARIADVIMFEQMRGRA